MAAIASLTDGAGEIDAQRSLASCGLSYTVVKLCSSSSSKTSMYDVSKTELSSEGSALLQEKKRQGKYNAPDQVQPDDDFNKPGTYACHAMYKGG